MVLIEHEHPSPICSSDLRFERIPVNYSENRYRIDQVLNTLDLTPSHWFLSVSEHQFRQISFI
jgi:hypothetical protein